MSEETAYETFKSIRFAATPNGSLTSFPGVMISAVSQTASSLRRY